MAKKSLMVISVEERSFLNVDELAHAAHVTPDFVLELIEYGVIEPDEDHKTWLFDIRHLRRVRTAVHLHRDLEINLAGVALVLDLMEQMEHMRNELQLLKRYWEL